MRNRTKIGTLDKEMTVCYNHVMKQTVAIPTSHFRTVRRDYADHHLAMFREFLQNSIDAGATSVDFVYNNGSMRCVDNGRGMDRGTLVDGMLTFSGSIKTDDSIGGFGQAKFLLIFQHSEYRILSRDLVVRGVGIQYDLDTTDTVVTGTDVTVMFDEGYFESDWHVGWSLTKAMQYFASCYLPDVEITVNGLRAETVMNPGEVVRELKDDNGVHWANVRVSDLPDGTEVESVIVQTKGVTMFTEWIGEKTTRQFYIDIIVPTTDILTTNRDGFIGKFAPLCRKVVMEICVDSHSFGTQFGKTFIFPGENRYFQEGVIDADIQASIDAMLGVDAGNPHVAVDPEDLAAINGIIDDFNVAIEQVSEERKLTLPKEHPVVTEYQKAIVAHIKQSGISITPESLRSVAEDVMASVENLHTDFVVKVIGKGINAVDHNLLPANMKGRIRSIARLWKYCVKLAIQARAKALGEGDVKFRVGWAVSIDTAAAISGKDGMYTFLLNPVPMLATKHHRDLFWKVLQSACHEVTHINATYHSETFVRDSEAIFLQAINDVGSNWWLHYQDAKSETI